ncbi:MAG: transketolase [Actinobacteria bacterium]|jgi:transketolase|nr:transketolase [Actinomycetota bacterium]
MNEPFAWTDLDTRAVDTARGLAMDAVQRVGNGHPGTAMSLAPAAYLIFQRHLRHDPSDPGWLGRDRFVLSAGHSSITLYTQLFLSGHPMTLDDLKSLRTWASQTPGHPEWGHTPGVETTTGPLGQGVANAVGMAMAARRTHAMLDPTAAPGASVFDHHVWVVAGDGDMQEGVTAEASSLAGTQRLGNLVVLWDDNHISIEDDTSIAFTEDVCARYEAYGWHVQRVDWLHPSGDYVEDVAALDAALAAARADTDRPSFIALRTIIGWPSPHLQGSGKVHGSALGAEEVAATKEALGLDPSQHFHVDDDVLSHSRAVSARGAEERARWDERFTAWAARNPAGSALLDRLVAGDLPADWDADVPVFEVGTSVATRAASGAVINALSRRLPELWGGSADLAGSNNTTIAGAGSFLPPDRSSTAFVGDANGRVLHFGVREHAMGAIMNGIALSGLTLPFGGTFLVFSDYMRPSVRLAALMGLPVTYVWTHDSIGVGEDGPTHQPVEHLAALRAIPGLDIVRPADANETAYAWTAAIRRHTSGSPHPVGLILSRQDLPVLPGTSAHGVARGGYILAGSEGDPDAIIIATGSEVAIALAARDALQGEVNVRVVSMPCLEWFEEQDREYRDSVLPPRVTHRVSVEAAISQPWWRLIGTDGAHVGIERFGASADIATLYREFGVTSDAVVEAVRGHAVV